MTLGMFQVAAVAAARTLNRGRLRNAAMRGLPALLACVLTTLCTVGCATGHHRLYAGPKQPVDQIAHIKSTGALDCPVRLLAVDGKRGPNGDHFGYSSRWDGGYHIEVLPGVHTLTVKHVRATAETEIRVDARGGHTYLIRAPIHDCQGQYQVYDKTAKMNLTREGEYTFSAPLVYYYAPYPPPGGGPYMPPPMMPPPPPPPPFRGR